MIWNVIFLLKKEVNPLKDFDFYFYEQKSDIVWFILKYLIMHLLNFKFILKNELEFRICKLRLNIVHLYNRNLRIYWFIDEN